MKRNLELSKSDIIKILNKNFGYQIVDTILGSAIQMPTKDAFLFCNVTGAGYLDDFVFQFSPKGLMKLFYNALDYKFVTGIFEKTSLRYTPYSISKKMPFVFEHEYKYIIPVEFKSDEELQDRLESVFDKIECPTDYIIMRVETSKKGNGLESFMEYLAAEYFKRQGFIVENQVPLAHSVGSPDFGGYDIDAIQKETNSVLPDGYHIIELAMLRLDIPSLPYTSIRSYPDNLIVGEAKTSTLEMDAQLRKYLDTDLFDWGFEIHPNKQSATANDRGMFTIDDDFRIRFTPPSIPYQNSGSRERLSQSAYKDWLEQYLKFHLLANLSNDEFASFYLDTMKEPIGDQEGIVDFVKRLRTKDIINKIIEVKNGSLK